VGVAARAADHTIAGEALAASKRAAAARSEIDAAPSRLILCRLLGIPAMLHQDWVCWIWRPIEKVAVKQPLMQQQRGASSC